MIRAFFLFLVFFIIGTQVHAQLIPPSKPDGFVYPPGRRVDPDTILIEAFYDPVCPYSRDSWPPLKQALKHYGSRVSLLLHLLPLPLVLCLPSPSVTVSYYKQNSRRVAQEWFCLRYVQKIQSCNETVLVFLGFGSCRYHDNAYVTSRALHIANTHNANATFSLLEGFFKHQVCSILFASMRMSMFIWLKCNCFLAGNVLRCANTTPDQT